jgi:hypothetical protein
MAASWHLAVVKHLFSGGLGKAPLISLKPPKNIRKTVSLWHAIRILRAHGFPHMRKAAIAHFLTNPYGRPISKRTV